LALEIFDDSTFDDNSNSEWIDRKRELQKNDNLALGEEKFTLTALGLY